MIYTNIKYIKYKFNNTKMGNFNYVTGYDPVNCLGIKPQVPVLRIQAAGVGFFTLFIGSWDCL